MESRAMPAVAFDPGTGLLTVMGDATRDDIRLHVDDDGFVEVDINGDDHSSDPSDADFDPALTGATSTSVTSILVEGDNGNDQIRLDDDFTAANGQITLSGGAGNDLIIGSDLAETLDGGDGRDRLRGHGGDDVLIGGMGGDMLQGHKGDDSLFGDEGNDHLQGHSGDDSLDGGDGNDRLQGHNGEDELEGGLGNDRLQGHNHDDTLEGGFGNDKLLAGNGDDELHGNDGDDDLFGGGGFDIADGGLGDDDVVGGMETELEAVLTGSTAATGEAHFELEDEPDGLEMEFVVNIEGATPNTTYDVIVGSVVVGQITTDLSGEGSLMFSNDPDDPDESLFPANFREIQEGAHIRVGDILNGTFVEDD